jgi:hypothetical protein
MNLNAAALKLMAAKGLTLEDVAEIVAANEATRDPTAAERMARMRARNKAKPVTRNVTPEPPNDNTLTPGSEAKASSPFSKCPEGVDPQHWADFRKARKRKNCTDSETAYRAVCRDLENFSDDEWPPGRLVQRSAEMGWARIVNPKEQKYDRPANQPSSIGTTERAMLSALASIEGGGARASFPD